MDIDCSFSFNLNDCHSALNIEQLKLRRTDNGEYRLCQSTNGVDFEYRVIDVVNILYKEAVANAKTKASCRQVLNACSVISGLILKQNEEFAKEINQIISEIANFTMKVCSEAKEKEFLCPRYLFFYHRELTDLENQFKTDEKCLKVGEFIVENMACLQKDMRFCYDLSNRLLRSTVCDHLDLNIRFNIIKILLEIEFSKNVKKNFTPSLLTSMNAFSYICMAIHDFSESTKIMKNIEFLNSCDIVRKALNSISGLKSDKILAFIENSDSEAKKVEIFKAIQEIEDKCYRCFSHLISRYRVIIQLILDNSNKYGIENTVLNNDFFINIDYLLSQNIVDKLNDDRNLFLLIFVGFKDEQSVFHLFPRELIDFLMQKIISLNPKIDFWRFLSIKF